MKRGDPVQIIGGPLSLVRQPKDLDTAVVAVAQPGDHAVYVEAATWWAPDFHVLELVRNLAEGERTVYAVCHLSRFQRMIPDEPE